MNKIKSWNELKGIKDKVESGDMQLYRQGASKIKYRVAKLLGHKPFKTIKAKMGNLDMCILTNDYPYFSPRIATHLVLWYQNDVGISQNDAKTIVLESFPKLDKSDIILWENPQYLKSVPEINHYQILLPPNILK